MAKGGRIAFDVDWKPFQAKLQAAARKVERGTKKATIAACEDIKRITLAEVPREFGGLAESFHYEIHGSYSNFTATMGYGGNGDPINPRTGQRASEYMVVVHEDLTAQHPIGKAKFLEDPLREYTKHFEAVAALWISRELG